MLGAKAGAVAGSFSFRFSRYDSGACAEASERASGSVTQASPGLKLLGPGRSKTQPYAGPHMFGYGTTAAVTAIPATR